LRVMLVSDANVGRALLPVASYQLTRLRVVLVSAANVGQALLPGVP
jgi:hypothetical protein